MNKRLLTYLLTLHSNIGHTSLKTWIWSDKRPGSPVRRCCSSWYPKSKDTIASHVGYHN